MERGRKMTENSYNTPCGCIHYFVNIIDKQKITLVFLPGLTADHRLFEKQTEYFEKRQNVFVWDAPSHALSRPFTNNYSLSDMAEWLYEILVKEEIYNPIIIGQSMGGYLAQMYMELYPDKIKGFISIDSAPLQKSYMTAVEIWLLERAESLYKIYPWKVLLRAGSRGCAETDYGQNLMRSNHIYRCCTSNHRRNRSAFNGWNMGKSYAVYLESNWRIRNHKRTKMLQERCNDSI